MAILNPLILPSSGKPRVAVASSRKQRRRSLLDPEFYDEQRRRQEEEPVTFEQRLAKQQEDTGKFDQEPVSGNYIYQQLSGIQGKSSPPRLDPGARVRTASMDLVSPNSFQQYYETLGLVKDIGDQMLATAKATSAFKKMQAAQNVYAQNGGTGGGGIPPTGPMPAPGNVNQTQSIVRDMAARQFGWTGAEWDALYGLVQRESGWNPAAANPNSAARGLFQKMINMHGPIESTVEGQAQWGLNYIKQRYGSPSAALRHWMSRVPINGKDVGHWY